MDLKSTVALITGAKRIGAVVAEELAKRGASVALSYARSREEAEAAVERVRAAGTRGEAFHADLSDAPACGALVDQAAATLGRLDILVNMASVYKARPFDELTVADWDASRPV